MVFVFLFLGGMDVRQPGYYEEGSFGVRIESVHVTQPVRVLLCLWQVAPLNCRERGCGVDVWTHNNIQRAGWRGA